MKTTPGTPRQKKVAFKKLSAPMRIAGSKPMKPRALKKLPKVK